MPPKPAAKDTKAAGDVEPDDEERELMERELALTYLRSKLGRYQQNHENLAKENGKLQQALEKEKNDLRDINEILTSELKVANVVCENLEKKNADLEEAYEKLQDNFRATVDKMRRERDDTVAALEARVADCEDQLKGLNDFIESKNLLEEKLAKLNAELTATKKVYQDQISDMERMHVQERERWKKELATKIKETKTQMLRLTDQQLELTTKRTIMENELMASELSYQSLQTEKIVGKNKEVMSENSSLKMQLELAKLAEQELAKRNLVYQRSIRSLLAKLKSHDEKTIDTRRENDSMQGVVSDLEERLRELDTVLRERDYERRASEAALQALRDQVEGWKARHDEASLLVMGLLEEVKGSLRDRSSSGMDRGVAAPAAAAPAAGSREGSPRGEEEEGEAAEAAPAAPAVHPLIAAAERAVRDKPDTAATEALSTLLSSASSAARSAAASLLLDRLRALTALAPEIPRSMSSITLDIAARASSASLGPAAANATAAAGGGPAPPAASAEPEVRGVSAGAVAKRRLAGQPGARGPGPSGESSLLSFPPISSKGATKASSVASTDNISARLAGTEFPAVEILMSQMFTDSSQKVWGPKARTLK